MLLVKTELRKSGIHGFGVFAAEFIPAGTRVWEYVEGFDSRLSKEFVASLPEIAREKVLHYSAFWGGGYVVSADDSRFLNHSFTPNLGTLPEPDIDYALRDIQIGEELTEDYREFDDGRFAERGIDAPARVCVHCKGSHEGECPAPKPCKCGNSDAGSCLLCESPVDLPEAPLTPGEWEETWTVLEECRGIIHGHAQSHAGSMEEAELNRCCDVVDSIDRLVSRLSASPEPPTVEQSTQPRCRRCGDTGVLAVEDLGYVCPCPKCHGASPDAETPDDQITDAAVAEIREILKDAPTFQEMYAATIDRTVEQSVTVAPTFADLNRERGVLIDRLAAGTITPEETARLVKLNRLADAWVDVVAPRDTTLWDVLEERLGIAPGGRAANEKWVAVPVKERHHGGHPARFDEGLWEVRGVNDLPSHYPICVIDAGDDNHEPTRQQAAETARGIVERHNAGLSAVAPEEPSAVPFDLSDGRNRYRPCPKCHANSGMGYSQGGIICIPCGFKGPRMGGPPVAWKDKWAFDAWNDLPRHEDTEMLDWIASALVKPEVMADVVNGRRWRGKYYGTLQDTIRAAMREGKWATTV